MNKITRVINCGHCGGMYTSEYSVCPNCSDSYFNYEKQIYKILREAKRSLKVKVYKRMMKQLMRASEIQIEFADNPELDRLMEDKQDEQR